MIFHPGTARHEHREIKRCGEGIDDREKSRQHGEDLQRVLDRDMVAEFSFHVDIDWEVEKRDEKETRSEE